MTGLHPRQARCVVGCFEKGGCGIDALGGEGRGGVPDRGCLERRAGVRRGSVPVADPLRPSIRAAQLGEGASSSGTSSVFGSPPCSRR
jgi:hypothetical protein